MKVKPGILKELILDNVAIPRISEHLGYIPVVFSAPRDIDLVYGSSQSRRRYIDHLLCQVDQDYLKALVTYNHLLDMRSAALKKGFPDLRRIITTYDEQMAPLAALIFEKRKWVVEIFMPLLKETYLTLSEKREGIDLIYESGLFRTPMMYLLICTGKRIGIQAAPMPVFTKTITSFPLRKCPRGNLAHRDK